MPQAPCLSPGTCGSVSRAFQSLAGGSPMKTASVPSNAVANDCWGSACSSGGWRGRQARVGAANETPRGGAATSPSSQPWGPPHLTEEHDDQGWTYPRPSFACSGVSATRSCRFLDQTFANKKPNRPDSWSSPGPWGWRRKPVLPGRLVPPAGDGLNIRDTGWGWGVSPWSSGLCSSEEPRSAPDGGQQSQKPVPHDSGDPHTIVRAAQSSRPSTPPAGV